jgi:DNA-binding NtrC family response regulator
MTAVLVVDDSALMLAHLGKLLRKAGYLPSLVTSWDQIYVAMRERPSIAVIDLRMPTIDGEVLTGIVKQYHPKLKVILLSSADDDEIRAAAGRCKADAWLSKRDIDKLPGLIEAVLNTRQR